MKAMARNLAAHEMKPPRGVPVQTASRTEPAVAPRGGGRPPRREKSLRISPTSVPTIQLSAPSWAERLKSGPPPTPVAPKSTLAHLRPTLRVAYDGNVRVTDNFVSKHIADTPEAARQKTDSRGGVFTYNTVINMDRDTLETRIKNTLADEWLPAGDPSRTHTLNLPNWVLQVGHPAPTAAAAVSPVQATAYFNPHDVAVDHLG